MYSSLFCFNQWNPRFRFNLTVLAWSSFYNRSLELNRCYYNTMVDQPTNENRVEEKNQTKLMCRTLEPVAQFRTAEKRICRKFTPLTLPYVASLTGAPIPPNGGYRTRKMMIVCVWSCSENGTRSGGRWKTSGRPSIQSAIMCTNTWMWLTIARTIWIFLTVIVKTMIEDDTHRMTFPVVFENSPAEELLWVADSFRADFNERFMSLFEWFARQ